MAEKIIRHAVFGITLTPRIRPYRSAFALQLAACFCCCPLIWPHQRDPALSPLCITPALPQAIHAHVSWTRRCDDFEKGTLYVHPSTPSLHNFPWRSIPNSGFDQDRRIDCCPFKPKNFPIFGLSLTFSILDHDQFGRKNCRLIAIDHCRMRNGDPPL